MDAKNDKVREFIINEIGRFRTKLLDLSKRNQLINFRHRDVSKKQIRVIDELPDVIFGKLEDGKKLSFEPLPSPDLEPDDEKTPKFRRALEEARQIDLEYISKLNKLSNDVSERALIRLDYELRDRVRQSLGMASINRAEKPTPEKMAEQLGLIGSYELPMEECVKKDKKRYQDNKIQTLLYEEDLELRLRAINEHARLTESETGVNTLDCAFGFLEWYESNDSEQALFSPLLLYPVEIEKEIKRGFINYAIQSHDEDVLINLPLKERMLKEFNVLVPDFAIPENESEHGDSPETYFSKISKLVEHYPNWKVHRWVTLSFFSFTRLVMYKDLDSGNWQGDSLPERLANVFVQKESDGSGFAPDYDVDSFDIAKKVPLHILDADSSQLSALIDVMDKKDMIIEGPPGTGKSQTISNIIAAALACGKNIIFVAEKLAALQIVKRRLDEVGVGEFCLELHSNKTRKQEVLKSLEKRLAMNGLKYPKDIDAVMVEIEQLKCELNSYVAAINKPVGKMDVSLHQVLGNCLRLKTSYPQLYEAIADISLDDCMNLDPIQIGKIQSSLHAFEEICKQLYQHNKSPFVSPWYPFIKPTSDILELEALWNKVKEFLTPIKELETEAEEFLTGIGVKINVSIEEMERFLTAISSIEIKNGPIISELLPMLEDRQISEKCRQLIKEVSESLNVRALLRSIFQDDLSRNGFRLNQISIAIQNYEEIGVQSIKVIDLVAESDSYLQRAYKVRSAHRYAKSLLEELHLDIKISIENYLDLNKAIQLACVPTLDVFSIRHSGLFVPGALESVLSLEKKVNNIKTQAQKLEIYIEIANLSEASTLKTYAQVLSEAGILSFFDKRYRNVRKTTKALFKRGMKLGKKEKIGLLFEAANYAETIELFKNDKVVIDLCGPAYKDLETNFEVLKAATEWALEVRKQLGASVFRKILLDGEIGQLKILREFGQDEKREETINVLMGETDEMQVPLDKFAELYEKKAKQTLELKLLLDAIGLPEHFDLRELSNLKEMLDKDIKLMANIDTTSKIFINFPKTDEFRRSYLTSLQDTLSFADILVSARLPKFIEKVFFTPNGHDLMKKTIYGSCTLLKKLVEMKETIQNIDQTNKTSKNETPLISRPISSVVRLLTEALSRKDELAVLGEFLEYEAEIRNGGLGQLLDVLLDEKNGFRDFITAFEFCLYLTIVRKFLNENLDLRKFSGLRHEESCKRFRELDRLSLSLQCKKIIADASRKSVPRGIAFGKASELTGCALIKHEIAKKKRHIPLRQLFNRAGSAIQALKPCFMMSPLSVAGLLAAKHMHFDLVVMDEASQLRPEDALGVIARGSQIIIVGDSKQLPPTNFFNVADESNASEWEENDIDGFESILELPKGWPKRRLKWHYRSKHESLIAFSNYHFYDHELIVFPSPLGKHPDHGIHFQHVNGIYNGSRNIIEAQKVVETAMDYVSRWPNRSLGIVALNQDQKDLILNLLDHATKDNPLLAQYRSSWDKTLEPMFVKNLENVQGDERDTIFISTVYGKDAEGNFYQRFGPINGVMGHRRLNVLFTRAKHHLVVVTSMDPDNIRVEEGSSSGLKALKGFLIYARDGILTQSKFEPEERPEVNDFEKFVKQALEERGYELIHQLGIAGYFMDLAVRHPLKPGAFLLGIECDGATYHYTRSARDRDRIRQEIIEKLGWKIHRIWSVDWFKNPNKETERICNVLERLLENK